MSIKKVEFSDESGKVSVETELEVINYDLSEVLTYEKDELNNYKVFAGNTDITGNLSGGGGGSNSNVFDSLQMNPVYSEDVSQTEGSLYYDSEKNSLCYYNNSTKVFIGGDRIYEVYNPSGGTITKGQVLKFVGAITQRPTVTKAIANLSNYSSTLCMAVTDIPAYQLGYVTMSGIVDGIDLSSFGNGLEIYLSDTTEGELVQSKPLQPSTSIQVGKVLDSSTDGKLLLDIKAEHFKPNFELVNYNTTLSLPTIPTVFNPTGNIVSQGILYFQDFGDITFLQSGSYSFSITINAISSSSNKFLYFYTEEDKDGFGYVINRFSARKLRLHSAEEEQLIISASRFLEKDTKMRFVLWADSGISLKSTDLPGTSPNSVTIPAFRVMIA